MHFSVSIIDHLRKNKKIIKSVLSSAQSRVLTCPAVLCRSKSRLRECTVHKFHSNRGKKNGGYYDTIYGMTVCLLPSWHWISVGSFLLYCLNNI